LMDIIIKGTLTSVVKILERIGFLIERRNGYLAGSWRKNGGRMHILLTQCSESDVYCDLHWDRSVHFLAFGVDYNRRPHRFYDDVLRGELQSNGLISEVTGGFSWLTRRNKALTTGLKI
jgi:hypothetical protein